MADAGILGIIQRRNPEKEFEILKQIGSGTYGEVYEAKVVKTGHKVALKIIKIEPGEDFNIIQQEIAILADCKHANIVGYSGSYLRRDRLWIAMEVCGGGSLQDIYHALAGGLNELQIAFVCREILKGLQYLHERNKIHRDIKGANILLTNSGEVKLADFGIAAQLTQTLLMKRKSFIGTPYWMAPEVAAVERKGGYNQQCDIWAVGITAVELAETQPPMFDLHPMRALYLMTKRNFKSPALQHKNKWSENFHEFLKYALQKEPRKRPTAQELLRHEFVNRSALCAALMLPLITVLEAPPPKSRTPVDDDTEDETPDPENKRKNFKRISSVKNQAKIGKQLSEAEMRNLNLVPSNQEISWAEADPNYRPNIQKLETVRNEESSNSRVSNNDDYTDPDEQPSSSPPPYNQLPPVQLPPVPPRTKEESTDAVYGNVDQPPVPPRVAKPPVQTGPPLPPKLPTAVPRQQKKRQRCSESDRRAYFSKVFNGCPLHLNCAASWVHPATKDQYVLLGAEEGLFSLHVIPNNPDPVMEQVSSRACHWLRVVENALIWLSGNSRFIATTNLTILFQTESQKQLQHSSYGRSKQSVHTAKMPDSKNCSNCCVSRNPYTDQRYLIAVVPKGILLMQWYQPINAFKLVQMFELTVPSPLHLFESFVYEGEEYPIVCFGIKESGDGRLLFDILDLNTHANWYTEEKPEGHEVNILCLQQLERDTFFIGIDRGAKFVDKKGVLKPSSVQASELTFDRKSEHMVYLSNCVLSFHKHGMQGKSLVTQQVTAEVADGSKVFHLLGSHGNIIIETRPLNDPTSPTNIYILVSEDGASQ